MNTFTSHDLKADAFPQVGVDPLDVPGIASRRLFPQWPANAGVTRPAAVSATVRAGLPPRRR
jgi:hypothetical protein